MGYYTRYELQSEPNIIETDDFKEKFNQVCGDNEYDYVIEEDCKWYQHDENMRDISKLYPFTLFMLDGSGEETGDIWRKYFFNGRMQFCKAAIVFEDFNENNLK